MRSLDAKFFPNGDRALHGGQVRIAAHNNTDREEIILSFYVIIFLENIFYNGSVTNQH